MGYKLCMLQTESGGALPQLSCPLIRSVPAQPHVARTWCCVLGPTLTCFERWYERIAQVQLVEGALICPETGRRFRVSKGIPNLLLNEDEC